MTSKKRILNLIVALLMLSLAALACGNGYRTTQKITGSSGEVRVRMNEGSGISSTSVEINEEWSWTRVSSTVVLSVESGSCQATLSGDEGTAITLQAAAGSPAQEYGDLVTDGFGDVQLQTDCQDARNLDLTISFSLR
jgi:hypothetical protein